MFISVLTAFCSGVFEWIRIKTATVSNVSINLAKAGALLLSTFPDINLRLLDFRDDQRLMFRMATLGSAKKSDFAIYWNSLYFIARQLSIPYLDTWCIFHWRWKHFGTNMESSGWSYRRLATSWSIIGSCLDEYVDNKKWKNVSVNFSKLLLLGFLKKK